MVTTQTMSGADPDLLDDLGRQLTQAAEQLRALQARVNARVREAPWAGRHAERFRTDWATRHLPATAEAATGLESAASVVASNAADQRQASAATGVPGSVLGVLPSVPPGLAGPLALANAVREGIKVFGKSQAYIQFLSRTAGQLRAVPAATRFLLGSAAEADAAAFARFVLLGRGAEVAKDVFQFGKPAGAFLSRIPGLAAGKAVAGRVFLPLTVLSGAADLITGGGYDGARGLTTRILGGAGAAGAGALLLAGAALGPVGFAVAGGAVLAYTAWSAGNYVYDHWGEISDFAGQAASSIADGATKVADTTSRLVSSATGALADGARSAVRTLSFGIL